MPFSNFPTTEQLQQIYKAIHGEPAKDIHRLRAAYIFNVPYDEVTKDQRWYAKVVVFGKSTEYSGYGFSGKLQKPKQVFRGGPKVNVRRFQPLIAN